VRHGKFAVVGSDDGVRRSGIGDYLYRQSSRPSANTTFDPEPNNEVNHK